MTCFFLNQHFVGASFVASLFSYISSRTVHLDTEIIDQ